MISGGVRGAEGAKMFISGRVLLGAMAAHRMLMLSWAVEEIERYMEVEVQTES